MVKNATKKKKKKKKSNPYASNFANNKSRDKQSCINNICFRQIH